MGYGSLQGHAIANPTAPTAAGTCDRCAGIYQHSHLRWQWDIRGKGLQNLRILVCARCEDRPAYFLKPIIVPPDPPPILNARPFPYCEAESDSRTTTNPALPPVDFITTTDTVLSGLQFIGAHQLQIGELILVAGQTNTTQNGIYKAATGLWVRQAYDNDRERYLDASLVDTTLTSGVLYPQQLGIYKGAVYVARGVNTGKLYQIDIPDLAKPVGQCVITAATVPASTVNRYDLFTGIYLEGTDYVRVTQTGDVRTPQQVGQAAGNTNETPGFSYLVPGSCPEEIGSPDQVPYGCATKQGLPSSMNTLPYSGPLWPFLQNQSIDVWLNNLGQPAIWVNSSSVEVTFNNYFWPDPGPGAPWRPIEFGVNNTPIFPPGGSVLFTNIKCGLTLWHNPSGGNVTFSQIYPNAIKPNKPAPWPFGWT